jgi:hypothetical protein
MYQTSQADSKALEPRPTSLHAAGGAVTEITPKTGRIIGGITLGGLFGIAGAGIVIGTLQTMSNPLWCLPGLGLLLVGVVMIVVMKRLAALRVLVTADGFAVLSLGEGRAARCYRIEPAAAPSTRGEQLELARLQPAV